MRWCRWTTATMDLIRFVCVCLFALDSDRLGRIINKRALSTLWKLQMTSRATTPIRSHQQNSAQKCLCIRLQLIRLKCKVCISNFITLWLHYEWQKMRFPDAIHKRWRLEPKQDFWFAEKTGYEHYIMKLFKMNEKNRLPKLTCKFYCSEREKKCRN